MFRIGLKTRFSTSTSCHWNNPSGGSQKPPTRFDILMQNTICVALTFNLIILLSEWLPIPIWQIQIPSFCCLLALLMPNPYVLVMRLREFHPSSKRLTRSTLFLLTRLLSHILGYMRINSLTCFHPWAEATRLSTARI